jgi:hypothetical protein
MELTGEIDGMVSRAWWLASRLAKVDNITVYHYYETIV